LHAAEVAKAVGVTVLSLTGADGGKLRQISDVLIAVPETETFKVQELHLPVYHALCMALENEFFGTM
jgi:D-sedoheptulose 7-phosphate isomerase